MLYVMYKKYGHQNFGANVQIVADLQCQYNVVHLPYKHSPWKSMSNAYENAYMEKKLYK